MLENNLKSVLDKIKNGNNLGEEITLVGATKMNDAETINKAVSLGLKVVAENKVQEFREKTANISPSAEQQFIGHLQTNKVKYLVGNVTLIQSVDSIHLAEEISKVATKKNVTQNILIEVNVGGELSKSGFDLSNVKDAVKSISLLPSIKVTGLMAMLPHTQDNDYLVSLMEKMRTAYDDLKGQGYDFKHLSMGMSGDYELAIKHGSNMIRLGSLIFGKRNYGVENK